MAKSTHEEKLARLKEKKAKIQKDERNLMNRISKKTRVQDTRKKIILGGLLLKMMEQDEILQNRVAEGLDKSLKKILDRELFNLSPLTEGK